MRNYLNILINFDLEVFVLKRMTSFFLLIGGSLVICYLRFKPFDLEYLLSAIGALIAFWYGYKKFTHEMDIGMFERYQLGKLTIETFSGDIETMINIFQLYQKGYIGQFIWNLINKKNIGVIQNFLDENLIFTNNLEAKKVKIDLVTLKLAEVIVNGDKEFYVYFGDIMMRYKKWKEKLLLCNISDKIKRPEETKSFIESLEKIITAYENPITINSPLLSKK